MKEIIVYALLYFSEAVIAWLYFNYVFLPKRKTLTVAIGYIVTYSILFGIYLLNNIALNSVTFLIGNIFLLWLCYSCAIKTAVLQSAFLTFTMLITEVVAAVILMPVSHDFAAYTYDFSIMVAMSILCKLLYLVFALIGAKLFAPHKDKNEEPEMMTLFCGLPALSVAIAVAIIYVGMSMEINKAGEIIIILSTASLLLVNLIVLVLYSLMQKSNREHLALQLRAQKDEADAVYYQALQKQYDAQRILVHDVKNHMNAIASLAQQEKAEEISSYLSQINKSLTSSQQARMCSNPILNMLLLRTAEECKEKEIEFQCDIREGCVDFMEAPAITALYGNLLSNAMEAAQNSQERLIELSVTKMWEQNMAVISLVNSCDTPPVSNGQGLFKTTKKSGAHGVGMKSISKVVKQYHGTMNSFYNEEQKQFYNVIQFQLK